MDIVGPLLQRWSGNVMCLSYATRYPPLKSIDVTHVVEEIIKVFAPMGVPDEILTDQGSNLYLTAIG